MRLVEDKKLRTRVVMGYDAESNSIISSFRGSDNIANYIEDADFFKTDYNLCEGC